MERRAFHDLFLAVLVFVTTFVAVKGFHTEKCDHQSLASNVKSAVVCIDKVQLASVEDIVERAEGEAEEKKSLDLISVLQIAQTTVSGLVKCMDVFFRACFKTDITGFIVQVISEILVPRPRPKWINSKVGYIRPGGFGEWNATSWRFIDFYFDKECTFEELLDVYFKEGQEVIDCLHNYFNSILDPSDSTTWCNALRRGIESCFKANPCFSKQEMDLLRDLTATIHTMAMKDLVRLNEKFGNFSMTLEALVTPIEPHARRSWYIIDDYLMDVAVDDFKTRSACQKTLMEYSMISNSPCVLPVWKMIYFTPLIILLSKLSIVSFSHV